MTNAEIMISNKANSEKVILENYYYAEVFSKIDDEVDLSNSNKKTKKFIFNKRISRAPKIKKFNIKGKTPQQIINLYNSLPISKKNQFLLEIYNSNYNNCSSDQQKQLNKEIYRVIQNLINSLSKSDKIKFINGLVASLKMFKKNNPNLSSKEKTLINQFIDKIKTSENNKYQDDDDSGIANIMMIIIKAFEDNMNSEGLDQMGEVNNTSLINHYLNIAQQILQENMKKQQDMMNKISKGHGSKASFICAMVGIALVMVVAFAIVLAPEVVAADASILAEGATEGLTEGAAAEGAAATGTAAEGTIEGAAEAAEEATQGATEGLTEGATEESAEASEEAETDLAKAEVKTEETGSSISEESQEVQAKSLQQIKTEEEIQDELKSAEQGSSKITEGKRWDRYWKWKDETGEVNGKEVISKGLKSKLPKVGKILVTGIMGFFGTYMIFNQFAPDQVFQTGGQLTGAQQTQIGIYQTVATKQNNVVNVNNNSQTTVSKRISDDSEKVSQAAGFVQQAINMFGQAYLIRA